MDNNYENIVPWNGNNDTGKDVRLKLARNFAKIGLNFEEVLSFIHSLELTVTDNLNTIDELLTILCDALETKLSKENDDIAQGVIDFKKHINVGENVVDSLLAGMGILLKDGRIQADRIELRSSLSVLELIYNRLQAVEGDQVYTEGGTIESIEDLGENTYRLTMRRNYDTDITSLDVDMILRGVVDTLHVKGQYYTSFSRVISKNTAENTITVVTYSDDQVPGGKNYPPAELMVVHRWGCVDANKPKWQQCWYLSSSEGRMIFLSGVNKPILEEYMYSTSWGKPIDLEIFKNLPINMDDPYIFARGAIIQDLIRIDKQGKPIYEIIDRGLWSADVANSADPYLFEGLRDYTGNHETHDVWNNSCRYRCLKSGTKQEPRWNSSDWDEVSGDPTLWIEFIKPNGDAFYGDIDCPIYVNVYKGVEDITDDILDADIEWQRTTEFPLDDAVWNAKNADKKKFLHITEADIPDSEDIASFTCIVFVRDGKNVIKITKSIDV